jgi:hypothetical protein
MQMAGNPFSNPPICSVTGTLFMPHERGYGVFQKAILQ